MFNLDFITWQADPEIFSILGRSIRWYGVLFALGFIIGQRIIVHFFKKNGYDEKLVDSFVIYSVLGTVIGARLGHVFFYGPYFTPDGSGYLDNPLSILYIWEGGLASHGAMFGLLASTYLFYKKKIKEDYLWLTDRLVITVALAGCFIRFGNLMNSEIIGKPTNAPQGFVFTNDAAYYLDHYFKNFISDIEIKKEDATTTFEEQTYQNLSINITLPKQIYNNEDSCKKFIETELIPYQTLRNTRYPDHSHIVFKDQPANYTITNNGNSFTATIKAYGVPRHPSQLYESISSFILFLILFFLLDKKWKTLPNGTTTAIFFIYIFTLRFFYEFLKENQVEMENDMILNMGQFLSIPAVLFGIALLLYSKKQQNA